MDCGFRTCMASVQLGAGVAAQLEMGRLGGGRVLGPCRCDLCNYSNQLCLLVAPMEKARLLNLSKLAPTACLGRCCGCYCFDIAHCCPAAVVCVQVTSPYMMLLLVHLM
jgi:hypothetical protein